MDQARLNLQYATIRAPIGGLTGSLRVRAGNLVRGRDKTPLVTINQIRPILVRFAVPATNLGVIQRYRDNHLLVRAPSRPAAACSARAALTFVDNAVDTTTGTILLKGTFPNTDGALWPGEFVNARLRLYTDTTALVVPASAVVSGQQGSFRVRGSAGQHRQDLAGQGRAHDRQPRGRRRRHRRRAIAW